MTLCHVLCNRWCYVPHMRMHVEIADDLVRQIDGVAGKRHRSQFVRDAIAAALDQRVRAGLIRSARGVIADRGHEWDTDPAAWVRAQRKADERRVG